MCLKMKGSFWGLCHGSQKAFSTEFGKQCVWIEDLYMKPESRGLGIGSKFFEYIEEKYADVVVRLEVEEENEKSSSCL